MTAAASTTMVVIDPSSALEVYSSAEKLQPYLDQIAAAARDFVADASTPKGREAIKSQAYKVTRAKTYLDDTGKGVVAELKDLPKKIDANRKAARDFLDALIEEIRQPVTEWEAEEKRKADEEAARVERERIAAEAKAAAEKAAADLERDHEFGLLMNAEHDRKAAEAQQQRQAEAAERAKREQEAADQRAREAAQKAVDDAKAAQEAAERAKVEAEQREKAAAEKAERDRIQRQKEEAARVEREKQEAAHRAEREKVEAARREREQAEREQKAREDAARRERERIEAEAQQKRDEEARRQQNLEHRRNVHREALDCLLKVEGIDDALGRRLIGAIASGQVDHIVINY
jgi:hypothetical protein